MTESFAAWRKGWPALEYESEYFGKDGAYLKPLVGGGMHLRHVHLTPVDDKQQREVWYKRFLHRSRKTSERHLVYTEDRQGNFLLIAILAEPSAHAVANMQNKRDKEIMEGFQAVAEAFRDDGEIIA